MASAIIGGYAFCDPFCWRIGMTSRIKLLAHHSLRFLLSSSCAALGLSDASFAQGPQIFTTTVVTPAGDQFWANSVIIEGVHEVMLVDAQLTKTNAGKVLQAIRATNKPLSIIYITHEHADHFLGLEVFKEAYPRVRILANSNVVDRINKVYQEKLDKWRGLLGADATSHVIGISKDDEHFIVSEGSDIEILRNLQGGTDANTMLWLPAQKTLLAGDVVFNDMRVYTP